MKRLASPLAQVADKAPKVRRLNDQELRSIDYLRHAGKVFNVPEVSLTSLKLLMDDKMVCQPLGKGGCGTTHLITSTTYKWVVKVAKYPTRLGVGSLYHELVMLGKLQGLTGVQKMVKVCPESCSLVTEYAGLALDDWLTTDSVSTNDKVSVLKQVVSILISIHGRGILHLDIKPANICVTRQDNGVQVCLIDFGLSLPTGRNIQFGEDATGYFMAPELLAGQAVDKAADAFSVARLIMIMSEANPTFVLTQDVRSWMNQSLDKMADCRGSLVCLAKYLSDFNSAS